MKRYADARCLFTLSVGCNSAGSIYCWFWQRFWWALCWCAAPHGRVRGSFSVTINQICFFKGEIVFEGFNPFLGKNAKGRLLDARKLLTHDINILQEIR